MTTLVVKTNGKSTLRDVILTTAFGLPFCKAALFFHSLAQTGYAGRIVVFTANLSRADRNRYAQAGATVSDHGIHLHRVLRRPLQMLFWNAVRHRPDSGSLTRPFDRLQQPNVLRWSLYRHYLAERADEFERVLMVDLRDVCFQRDPFEGIDPEFLRTYAEEEDITVGPSEWNSLAMHRAFGQVGVKRWGNLRVSCSGVVAGGTGPVMSYLDAFGRMLPELRMPDHGTDQAIHTRIVHADVASLVQWQGNREGDAVQLAGVRDADSIARDTKGLLLNDFGCPFAIVHQFDRHPGMVAALHRDLEEQASRRQTASKQPVNFANRLRESCRMLVLRRIFPVWFRLGGAGCGAWNRSDKLTVVLLSYGRAANLNSIVAACLACPFVQRVILSNNNPDLRMREFVREHDDRLQITDQTARCFPSKRYELARESGDEWLLCIDDDTFLTPRQIRSLFEALLANPTVPHGVAGENFRPEGGFAEYLFGTPGKPEAVDCLVWAYAFTHQHAERYFELLHGLGIENANFRANEDIVLSLTGNGRPLVHNFGTLHLCGSRDAEDVATSKQTGFREQRESLLRKTQALTSAATI